MALLALVRTQLAAAAPVGPGTLRDFAGRPEVVELRGRVVAEPERTALGTRLRVAGEEARSRAIAGTAYGDLLATVPDGSWRYGDRVVLVGRVDRPVDR